ncbi:MAG: transglycosylase SLT domain-containing protein [Terracidiphilus sp.]|nr:transglycosylase SLT domain-containing protein [Terracidiphilus sp.]
MHMTLKQLRLSGCALLVLSLAGCNPSQSTKPAEGTQPQATAPALPAMPTSLASANEQPVPATLEQRRVRQLIQQVEEAYNRGVSDYRKGKLPEAKAEFDRSVDLMLSSGIDIKSDAQLQDEFDRIVDAVNALEMEALKEGNGFVPKMELSPADVASDVTFEVDPNVVAKARTELATTKSDLPLVVNDYVAVYLKFFGSSQRGHNTLLHSFQRAGRYKAMIQRVMAEEGVPQDMIYLAVAESGFNPRALNAHSGAGGMWQFMPHGDYGLTRNAYVDERFDPEKSTRASARYMKFIYNQLGDWYLAMAGYNWGAGNVQRAVQKTGYADFWELYKRNNLPAETKNYVPEILAAIIIANNPTQYGFDDFTLDPPVVTDTVTINYSVDLRLVSDIVGAPMEEMAALNPSLLRYVTPPDASFDLHLPAGTGTLFTKRIEEIPEARRTSWRYHRVAAGDTLASVAHDHHVAVAELAAANQLSENDSISGMEALVIPVAPAAAPASRMLLYTARKGDTLVTIADRFGVSLDQLRHWNKITGTKVEPGRRLHVAEAANVPHATRSHRRGSSAGTRKDSGEKAQAKDASAEKGVDKGSASTRGHRKGHASAIKKGHAEKPATAVASKKSGTSSAKSSHAQGPATKQKSSKKKQK